MPTTERSSSEGPTLQRSPPTSRMGFASLVYPMSMVWASSLVRTSNTADSSLLLPPNSQIVGRERRELVSQLAWCGEGCFDSRRRVNSTVRRLSCSDNEENIQILRWMLSNRCARAQFSLLQSPTYPELCHRSEERRLREESMIADT